MAWLYYNESKTRSLVFAGMIVFTLLNSGVSVIFAYVGRDVWSAPSSNGKIATNINNVEREHGGSSRSQIASFKVLDILRRANALEREGRDILHLEVGQPESGAPALVAKAAADALTGPPRKVMGYTEACGLPALRQKITAHYGNKYGLKGEEGTIDIKNIVITTGSSGAFLLAFTACFDVGDVVAVASSGYPCYRNILKSMGCEIATVPINEDFKLTAKELLSEVRRRETEGLKPIKGLILSSPSNPTGVMLDKAEVEAMCIACDDNNIQFISDEIYHGITYGTKVEATARSFSKNAIVINSFSKYYSMSGWRLGWMVVPDRLIDPINRLQQNMFINAPTISQTAAIMCWEEDTIRELESHVAKYSKNRERVLQELENIPEIEEKNIAPADGGLYVYVDLGKDNVAPDLGSVAMCSALLEEEGVAFTPGIDFEDPKSELGDRRFRISYAGSIDNVSDAMKRFRTFWIRWHANVKSKQYEMFFERIRRRTRAT